MSSRYVPDRQFLTCSGHLPRHSSMKTPTFSCQRRRSSLPEHLGIEPFSNHWNTRWLHRTAWWFPCGIVSTIHYALLSRPLWSSWGLLIPIVPTAEQIRGYWWRACWVVNMDTGQTIDCSIQGNSVGQSDMQHPDARIRALAVSFVGAGDTDGYYYGSLAYTDSRVLAQGLKWYREASCRWALIDLACTSTLQ